jgi:hypothetical protein
VGERAGAATVSAWLKTERTQSLTRNPQMIPKMNDDTSDS